MYILGINAFHWDASACIIKDGSLIAATEEERINRIKHWSGFPIEAIKFCLGEAGISIHEVDYITVGNDPYANIGKKILTLLKKVLSIELLLSSGKRNLKKRSLSNHFVDAFSLEVNDIKGKLKNIEHHRSHLASAFYPSPFEEAALVSIDAFGDFTSTMRAVGKGNKIEVIDSVLYPHSIGMFYTAFTQLLGFPHVGDEYKVMGLAPYGQPKYVEKVRDVIFPTKNGLFELNTKYFSYITKGLEMSMENDIPFLGTIFSKHMTEKFGEVRNKNEPMSQHHMDIATSVQVVTEEIIFHILNGLENLCIAGGCAQNSVANGKYTRNTTFKNIFIPPAGHDAGLCVGSALYYYYNDLGNIKTDIGIQAYTGARFSNDEIEQLLKEKNIIYNKVSDEELVENVSTRIIEGGVIGWFQGRAEFGPRALGGRSILVDPRREDAKELLNLKIKKRESFRPFAPSILEDHVGEYFEIIDEVPFMEKVFPIKKEMQLKIPAVTHVDGSGRLQTVSKKASPKYYALIDKFREKTGVPILLNTSFNENEPIVNNPLQALDCFLRTSMDMLVLENCVIDRKNQSIQ